MYTIITAKIRLHAFITLLLLMGGVASMPCIGAEQRVVVIPLSSKAPVEKKLFIPATMFRPVDPAINGIYKVDGTILAPDAAGYWIAPLLLPVNATISSLQLLWKNNTIYPLPLVAGSSAISLLVLSDETAARGVVYTQASTDGSAGVHTVTTSPNFTVADPLHPFAHVYLGDPDRWLVGVKVTYTE